MIGLDGIRTDEYGLRQSPYHAGSNGQGGGWFAFAHGLRTTHHDMRDHVSVLNTKKPLRSADSGLIHSTYAHALVWCTVVERLRTWILDHDFQIPPIFAEIDPGSGEVPTEHRDDAAARQAQWRSYCATRCDRCIENARQSPVRASGDLVVTTQLP